MGAEVEGLDETLDLYQSAIDAMGEQLADAVHEAIIEEYRRREAKIPVHTGALRKALLNPRDRFHSAEVKPTRRGWALEVGVTGNWTDPNPNPLRAAVFQGHRKKIPQPVTRRVVAAVHAAYEGAISAGSLTGDVGAGRIRRRSKRRRRRRRG